MRNEIMAGAYLYNFVLNRLFYVCDNVETKSAGEPQATQNTERVILEGIPWWEWSANYPVSQVVKSLMSN